MATKPPSAEDHIGEIASAIATASLRPERWQTVVDGLREAIPGSRVVFQAMDRQGGLPVPMTVSGWPDDAIRSYLDHFRCINPWAPVLIGAPSSCILSTEDVLPASAFRQSAFYTDWLAPIGGADAATSLKVMDADGRTGLVLVHYDARRAGPAHADATAVLRRLGPVLRTTLDLQRLSGDARAGPADVPLLGRLGDPAMLVDGALRLHAANAAGDALLASGGRLRVGAGDRLQAMDPLPDAQIAAAVRSVLPGADGQPVPVPAVLRLGRESFDLGVMPVATEMRPLVGIAPLMVPRTLALLTLRPRASSCLGDLETGLLLRQRYRLTPAEIRLAMLLDGRLSLVDVADRLGVSYETARSHARSIYAKSDLRGQADLARLVADLRAGS